MPTAAKLIAALFFAGLGAAGAVAYIPLLPEGTLTGWLIPGCAAIGLWIGWWIMGGSTGKSYAESMATGLRTSLTVIFFALLLFSIYVMILRSTKMLYDGPMEALLATFAIGLDYAKLMVDRNFIGLMALGGLVGGFLAEFTGRRWS